MTEKQRVKQFRYLYRQCVKRSSKYSSFEQYWKYDDFLASILSGDDPFEFVYKNELLTIQQTGKQYVLTVETEAEAYQQQFASAEELVENATIDGKTFEQIWDELK